MHPLRYSLSIGFGLVLTGVCVLVGWSGQWPGLIRFPFGFEGMPYSTAAGFVLAGLALIASAWRQLPAPNRGRLPAQRFLPTLLAWLLILLATAGLAEWQFGLRLGLSPDPGTTLHWLDDGNPYPGRIRPLAALAFFAFGATILLLPRVRGIPAFALAHGLILLVLSIGLMGIAGQLAGFGRIYAWFLGPVFSASVGLVLGAFGLFALLRGDPAYLALWDRDDDAKIGLVAGAIVVATGLVGILGGFAVLYPQTVTGLENNLALSLRGRIEQLKSAIEQGWLDSYGFGNQPLRTAAMAKLNRDPQNAEQLARIRLVAASYRNHGFSAVLFRDATGREVARAGAFLSAPELRVQIRTATPGQLLWHRGYYLRTRIEMRAQGEFVGTLETERPLPVDEDLDSNTRLGSTLDFAVCAPAGGDMDCFPFRSTGGKVLHRIARTIHGHPLPMDLALAGRWGIVQSADYRGVQVIAAHAPIGTFGLGAVLKIDAEELYRPIAAQLGPLLALLALLATVSIAVLRLQVTPLARKMAREIAQRKNAEAGLQESQAQLTEIAATLGEGVYVLDAQARISYVNPEAERLLGWSAAELIGRGGHDTFHFKHPDGTVVPAHQCPFHQAVLQGQSYRAMNDWFVRKDGSLVPVSIVSNPILRDGRVQGSVASFSDIGARLEAERALRESEERFRLISASATDGILTLGPEGEIVYWNPAAERIFGYSADEALGRPFHDLAAPARYLDDFRRGFQHFVLTGEGAVVGKTFEITALRKNGEEFPVELSVSALRIKDRWHALGVVRDISARKQVEERIRHLAYYDALTDLPNRRLFSDRLNQALVQAKRYRRSMAVLYLDLDRFKIVNDSLGHDAGDRLLVAVAERLQGLVREGDTVSRLGGDEFAMVLAEIAQPGDAAVVAEKVIERLEETVHIDGHDLQVTTSIGIAIYPVDGTDDALALMKQADIAMYEAKAAGRNRYAFAPPG